jgi:two-component system cell cycle sensor histidine kinase PleC
MNEYSTLVGDAVLRHRSRIAEHKARLEIELANRIKSEFIANMSHELRTPLNTVIGFSKLLSEHDQRRLPDAEITQYSELIREAACRLLAAINDILDISKMKSGAYALDARETNLEEILHACLRAYKGAAEEAGVTVRHRIAFNLPPVRGDSAKLKQVFSNLLSNAIKFTLKGGEVTLEAYEHGDGGVLVSIRDTGIGMTDEELKVALALFGQVDGGRTRWREGTGLGLPIAKALVELHGGEFVIVSSKGKGTDATVILPPRHKVSLAQGRDVVFGNALAS